LINKPLNRNILKENDVIGFDIDHTLGIYNLTTLAELLYSSFTKYLIHNKNYTKNLDIFNDLQEAENMGNETTEFLTKENFYKLSGVEILIDLNRGTALKISHSGNILKAFHGKNELSENEIKKVYGNNKEIPREYNFKFDISKSENYFYSQGYFDYHLPAIYLFCVELYDRNILKIASKEKQNENGNIDDNINAYKQIMKDIMDSLMFNYAIIDKKMEETGNFYPEISRNPKRYLCENSARKTLILLKKIGIKIFYATNSYKEFGDLIMRNSLGEDFHDLFDICISFSSKPGFFLNKNIAKNEINFKFSDTSLEKYKKKDHIPLSHMLEDMLLFDDIKNRKAIVTDSFVVVEKFFDKLLNKTDLKYLYVGDSILNDCIAPVKNSNVKSIAVIEFIDSFYHGIKPDHLGEAWRLDIEKDKQQMHVFLARDNAEFSISNVQTLKLFC